MKDYSIFVNSSYLITFAIIAIFSSVTIWNFKRNSKKLANLDKKQNANKKKS